VTPENEFAKRQLRYSTCFTAGFSGSPIGCPITFFSAHHIPVHKAASMKFFDGLLIQHFKSFFEISASGYCTNFVGGS
jgi:hypothetical protein